jgi:hypothetical protein
VALNLLHSLDGTRGQDIRCGFANGLLALALHVLANIADLLVLVVDVFCS